MYICIYIYIYMYILYIFLLQINGVGSYLVKYVLEKYYGVNKKLTPNVPTWTWYDVIMIENMSLYAHRLDIELDPLVQIIITFFIILFFMSINLYKAVISKIVYLFSNVYINNPSFMKNNIWKTLIVRKYFVY